MTNGLAKASFTIFSEYKTSAKKQEDSIEVMFNPTDLSKGMTVNWTKDSTNPAFKGVEYNNFTLNLFYDSYEQKADVREGYNKNGKKIEGMKRLIDLAVPSDEKKQRKTPPTCLFQWGKNFTFTGVVSKIDQKFTMFLADGTPVRGTLTITLQPQFLTARDSLKYKGMDACRKIRKVKEGDRLDLIAFEELKDASLWVKIAEANDIMDPLSFPSESDINSMIVIPD